MSRIGNAPINLPKDVSVAINGTEVKIKGPKGELTQDVGAEIIVSIDEGAVIVKRPTEQKRHKSLHGLYRSLLNNMVIGVSEGFKRELELVGVGYKAAVQDNVLELNLGYSHSIYLAVPGEVSVMTETAKGKNPTITLESVDKQLIGQIAAKIRSFRKVEPYKGKGIRFVGEQVRRKAGKTAAK